MKLGDLISISPGFQRSISLKYDLHDGDKVRSFIPTEKFEGVIEHVLEAIHNEAEDAAAMLIGSYGTGKSHLAMVIGSLLGKRVNPQCFAPVLNKIRSPRLKRAVKREMEQEKPFLIVPVSGGIGDSLDVQLLSALKRALEVNRIQIPIQSSFALATEAIERWKQEFPDTYQGLGELLLTSSYQTVDNLVAALENSDKKALDDFRDFYPVLSAGARFDLYQDDVVDVYEGICRELSTYGYRGILLLYDEFNRVLDGSIRDGRTLKTLQELAELASRSVDSRLYMLLISHRTIGQYLENVTSNMADEWRRVEGRFKIFDVANKPWESYDLISRVLQKDNQEFYDILVHENPDIAEMGRHRRLTTLFAGIDDEVIDEVIVKGCLPLHPITTFLLPRISAKLAQNERTLFTFLAGRDGSPLPEILEKPLSMVELVHPWQVYDYFEPQLMRARDENLKYIRTQASNAIESLPHDATAEIRLLKTMAIFQVAGNTASLPCTAEMLEFAMGTHDFEHAVHSLLDRKILYIRQATDEFEIVEPADLDIEAELERWRQEEQVSGSPLGCLGDIGIRDYVIPNRYNLEQRITRFLTPVYADIDNISSIVTEQGLAPIYDGCDGVICYLYPETRAERRLLLEYVKDCLDQRVVFALPKAPVPVRDITWRLRGLLQLKKSLSSITGDPRAEDLVRLYVDDARQDLQARLSQVTIPSPTIDYFWAGKQQEVVNGERELSQLVGTIMKKVYDKAPIINNELVNKNKPTSTSRRARNDVINSILQEEPELRFRTAQERMMYESLFVRTGLHNNGVGITIDESDLSHVLIEMEDFFLDARNKMQSFADLLHMLIGQPYGIRKGVIPVLLTALSVKYKQYITIRDRAGIDQRIDAALFDKIVSAPKQYTLILEEWDEAAAELSDRLGLLFTASCTDNIFFANRFGDLSEAIFRWYSSLPRYARETNTVSNDAKALRRCARIANRNPKQVMLRDLPQMLGMPAYELNDVEEIDQRLRVAKEELEQAITVLEEEIKSKLHDFLKMYGLPGSSLTSLARNMVDTVGHANPHNLEWASLLTYIKAFEGDDEQLFVRGLAQEMMGVRLEDWLDKTQEDFFLALDNLAKAQDNEAVAGNNGARVEMLFLDSAYASNQKITIYQAPLSDLASLLQSHLEATMNDFGDSISPVEKQLILVNILKNIS